jgi:hypothetical protein
MIIKSSKLFKMGKVKAKYYGAVKHCVFGDCVSHNKHIPRRGGSLGTYPAWFDRELIYLIRRKYKAWQRYKRSERIHAYNIFKQLRAEVKVKERHAYNNYVTRMSASVKANPKYFWSFVNSIKKSTSIPDVMNYDGSILKDPKDIVDKFAGYLLLEIIYGK